MIKPLVSVGIQCYNNERTLGAAIRSVLQQSYSNWELIIHDDGSTDASARIARGFSDSRIQVYHGTVNRKRCYRLNESLRVARGRYYAVMDGDDIAYPYRLEAQVSYMESHPEVDLLGGGMLVFADNGRPVGRRLGPASHEEITRKPFRGFPMAQPTFFGKLTWFRRWGYKEEMRRTEDQDLLLRSFSSSHFANLSFIVLGYFEAGIRGRRILRDRLWFTRSMLKTYLRSQPFLASREVIVQCVKGVGVVIAAETGLGYHLLRHRARPITSLEAAEWNQVWQTVSVLGRQEAHF